MPPQLPTLNDYTRFGKDGPIVRRDAVGAILPANLGTVSVLVIGGTHLPLPMKPDAVLDALVSPPGLDLTADEAERLGMTDPPPTLVLPGNGKAG